VTETHLISANPTAKRALVATFVLGLALACTLSFPAFVKADAPQPGREGAAGAVYTAVATLYRSDTVGKKRNIETSCSGSAPNFSCKWWVIKNRFDRVSSQVSDENLRMSRRGEGEQHQRPSKVKFSGSATATWACTTRTKKNVCKAGSFSVSLK